jgi:GDP-4-dehydro-6-deoxy-D-mannose reductase
MPADDRAATRSAVRALVTGAGGFVGRHLIAHLDAMGDLATGTDRAHGGPDLLDTEGLSVLLKDAAPEVVYHLAGWADVGGSWKDPEGAFTANALGTLSLLEAARAAGVRRVVNVSSADVYGRVRPEDLPIDESQPLAPVTPYAASKVAADYLGLQAWLGHGLEVIRVRAFNHLGPGQSEAFLAPAVAMKIARNERDGGTEVTVGNLDPRRDITDVRDVVRAYHLLMERGRPGEVYNVCSGRALEVREICEHLLRMAASPMSLVADPALQRPVDTPVLMGDNSKLRAQTGWEPQIPIDRTLADLLADCRARAAAEIAG